MTFLLDRIGAGALAGARILVAEDKWHVAQSLRDMLEGAGATVLEPVATVATAMKILDTYSIDAAVVDMNLRDAMADDLVEELYHLGVPVVVVTGYQSLPSNTDHLIAARLQKPVRYDLLVASLKQALKR